MSRRRITSMPVGLVVAALLVIALVALAAVFLTGGAASEIAKPESGAPGIAEPARVPE